MVPDFRFRVESSGIVLSLFGIQFENMLFLDRFLVDFSRCNSGQRGLRNPDIFRDLVSVRARGVISGVGDSVFRGGAGPTPECGVAGGHRVHRYGGVCTLQP